MKIYTSQYREKEDNTLYSNELTITSIDDLKAAVRKDHIAAKMKDGHRSSDNFIQADCIMLDLDNTHSADPAEWKTIDDIADAFPDVPFYYIQSRNYMKPKTKKARDGKVTYYEPREKYHCYFPLAKTYNNFAEYEKLMLTAAGLFPFFDLGAAKPAQFFFGVAAPAGGTEPGGVTLDRYIAQQPAEAVIDSVKAFVKKVRNGEYKGSSETEKAVSRLMGYFGITPAAENETTGEYSSNNKAESIEQYSSFGLRIAEAEQKQRLEWFEKWAKQHNIPIGKQYKIRSKDHPNAICICVPCPWEDEHSMNGAENEAVVIIDLGGRLSFLCRHSHGAMLSWKDYRAHYEMNAAQDAAEAAQTAPAGSGDIKPGQQDKTQESGAQTRADALQGLLTYSVAVNIFETADNEIIDLKSFPAFSKTAKIKKHDSIVIAADTGGGKSSLAINFMNDLSENYPCIYINLEMDTIDVLQRLVAIQSGLEIDRIQGYQNDQQTAKAVNVALQTITKREPLQIIQGAYLMEEVQDIIEKSTKGREKPTAVFIDHSLLMDTRQGASGRYDRFTQVSEGLRKMALKYNIILFVLLQQNRAGKAIEEDRPKNSSLKESGSWENDSTQICFLWYDPADRKKKLLLTKNRHGNIGEFALNYWKKTQTYTEANGNDWAKAATPTDYQPKLSRREKQRGKLEQAYTIAYTATNGHPTLRAMAEAADVTTATVKSWIKEYGGCTVDGVQQDPAGIDTTVEYTGFIKLTPADNDPYSSAKQEKLDNRI